MIRARTKSADDTRDFAAALAEVVQSRDLLLLIGEIGAGKTTFAQGFGQGLGVHEPITSPTFVLLRTYDGDIDLHHVDIYRIEHLQEVIDIGLLELLDEGGVALMEWGDIASPVLPRDYLEIQLTVSEDTNERAVVLRGVGQQWALREKTVAECIGDWVVEGPTDKMTEGAP